MCQLIVRQTELKTTDFSSWTFQANKLKTSSCFLGFLQRCWVTSGKWCSLHIQCLHSAVVARPWPCKKNSLGTSMSRSGFVCRALADVNADGKMDQKEFSIAVCLIQKKLKGVELPKVLPPGLMQDPLAGGLAGLSMGPTPASPGLVGGKTYGNGVFRATRNWSHSASCTGAPLRAKWPFWGTLPLLSSSLSLWSPLSQKYNPHAKRMVPKISAYLPLNTMMQLMRWSRQSCRGGLDVDKRSCFRTLQFLVHFDRNLFANNLCILLKFCCPFVVHAFTLWETRSKTFSIHHSQVVIEKCQIVTRRSGLFTLK